MCPNLSLVTRKAWVKPLLLCSIAAAFLVLLRPACFKTNRPSGDEGTPILSHSDAVNLSQEIRPDMWCLVQTEGSEYHVPSEKAQEARDLVKALLLAPGEPRPIITSRSLEGVRLFSLEQEDGDDNSGFAVTFFEKASDGVQVEVQGRDVGNIGVKCFVPGPDLHQRLEAFCRRVQSDSGLLIANLAARRKPWRVNAIRLVGKNSVWKANPVLKGMLRDKDPDIRIQAALALIRIGDHTEEGVKSLLTDYQSKDKEVRRKAGWVLAEIAGVAPETIIPYARKGLRDEDPELREDAVMILREIGRPAVAAVPDLEAALEDRAWGVRSEAAYALGEIGPGAMSAVPVLCILLNGDEQWQVQVAACCAIRRIKPAKDVVMVDLLKAMRKDHLRRYAALAIVAVDPGNPEATRVLEEIDQREGRR